MAEVATKKSINVVSNKKSEVCGVQSNNGLIDLDDLTASNNQLISLCDDDDDDDLVLTNNTRNELDNEDKSLQELIESELALRICSSKSDDDVAEDLEEQSVVTQPETIKRIVLDRRQDPVDINAEFIAAESEHYSLIEEPHQNGHVSPNVDVVKPESVYLHDEEEEHVFVEQPEVNNAAPTVVQKTCDDDWPTSRDEPIDSIDSEKHRAITKDHAVSATDVPDSSNVISDLIDTSISQPLETCSINEEEELVQKMPDDTNLCTDVNQENEMNADVVQNTCTEQALLSSSQQFSDNFNETLYQQNRDLNKQKFPSTNEESSTNEYIEKIVDSSDYVEERISTSPISQDKQLSEIIEEADSKLSEKHEEDPHIRKQFENFDDGISSQSEMFTETISTQEFLAMERRVLNEEVNRETAQTVASPEITSSPATSGSIFENESIPECLKDIAEDAQNPVDESSSELSASDLTFIEKTEVVVSDTSVTIFSETKQIVDENLDSWTTVEEATKSAGVEEKRETERSGDVNEATRDDNEGKADDSLAPPVSPRAPLATPDETETSDVSNACDVSVLFSWINSDAHAQRNGSKERETRTADKISLFIYVG